jgi:hypothetical protein
MILGEQKVTCFEKFPLNNFSTARPIFTISIPIDSSRQAKKWNNQKSSKFHDMGATGEFSCEKYPEKLSNK